MRATRPATAFVLLLTLIACAAPRAARAETQLSFYVGKATHHDSDLEFNPGGAGGAFTFDDVSWDDESFESPLYYGLRATHFFAPRPNWGLALDVVHAKMYAEFDDDNGGGGGGGGLAGTFNSLNFSHGLNLLTLNAL